MKIENNKRIGLYHIKPSPKLKGDGLIYLHRFKFLSFVTLFYPGEGRTAILTKPQARQLKRDRRLQVKRLV